MSANINHDFLSTCSVQPWLKSGENRALRETKEGKVYLNHLENHGTTQVTRVRIFSGPWMPQSYSLPPKPGLSSPLSSS